MQDKITSAGKGEHRYYILRHNKKSDSVPFVPGVHYIGIDAVRWYVNKQGNFLTNRIASGTTSINLHNEKYQTGLGTYELKAGEYTAPVFDRPLLTNRVFRGGILTLRIFIQVINEDKLLKILLRDLAKTSLNITASAVNTVSSTGPPAILSEASKSLIKSVEKILTEGGKPKMVFDPSGVEINIKPTELSGSEIFILVHRGQKLDSEKLNLRKIEHGNYEVSYENSLLEDGAWCLFKIRREDSYGFPRPWENESREVRNEIRNLFERWLLHGISKTKIAKILRPTNQSPPSIGDKVLSLTAQIRKDWALTELEAVYHASELQVRLKMAQDAVKADNAELYQNEGSRFENDLKQGKMPSNPDLAKIFEKEASILRISRKSALVERRVTMPKDMMWSNITKIGKHELKDLPLKSPIDSLKSKITKSDLRMNKLSIGNLSKIRRGGGLKGGSGGLGGGSGGGIGR